MGALDLGFFFGWWELFDLKFPETLQPLGCLYLIFRFLVSSGLKLSLVINRKSLVIEIHT